MWVWVLGCVLPLGACVAGLPVWVFTPCFCCLPSFTCCAACFNYNPQGTDGTTSFVCANPVPSVGVSWNTRPVTNPSQVAPYDQGIVFFEQERPGPYFKYNYIENVNTASTTNSWQVQSYIGPGSTATNSENCGCRACPSMTCNLAKTGPRTGALTTDVQYPNNMAYNPLLETCAGATGSCLSMNGDACCVGTGSYEYRAVPACSEMCKNYWSGISKDRPLSAIWGSIMKDMPVAEPSPPAPPPPVSGLQHSLGPASAAVASFVVQGTQALSVDVNMLGGLEEPGPKVALPYLHMCRHVWWPGA